MEKISKEITEALKKIHILAVEQDVTIIINPKSGYHADVRISNHQQGTVSHILLPKDKE